MLNTGRHIHGLLSEYIAQPGVQCYKDLAGNLKQVCCWLLFMSQLSIFSV